MTDLTPERIAQIRATWTMCIEHNMPLSGHEEPRELMALLDMAERTALTNQDLELRRATYRECIAAEGRGIHCPIHGACACRPQEDPLDQAIEGSITVDCPLHNPDSAHAVPPYEDR